MRLIPQLTLASALLLLPTGCTKEKAEAIKVAAQQFRACKKAHHA